MAAIQKHLFEGGSGSVLYTDRRDFYIRPHIVKTRYPNVAPFLTAVSSWNTVTGLDDPQYKMFEYTSQWVQQYFQVTTGATSAADDAEDTLAITVTNAKGMPSTFTNHLLGLKLQTHANVGSKPSGAAKGTFVVTTFTSTTSIKVKNLTGSSVVIANDDWLVVIGTAFGEATEAANPAFDELSVVWNQSGIRKTAFQLSKTIMESNLRGESKEYNRLKRIKGQEHMIQKERDLLFSVSNIGTNLSGSGDTFGDGGRTDLAGNTIRSTYGAFNCVWDNGTSDITNDDQNLFPINESDYSYVNWVDDTEKIFDENPDGVLPMFVGNKLLSFFNKIEGTGGAGTVASSKWTVNFPRMDKEKASRLGFNIREWESPHGIIQFVRTPVFTKSPYGGYGLAVDPTQISHVVFRKPKFEQNIKIDNAPDYQKNQYFSDEGILMTNLYNHNIMYLN